MTPPNTGPRAILFDMDDTLFDHSKTCELALSALRDDIPVFQRVPLPRLTQRYGELLDSIYPSVLSGGLTHEEARVERFRRLLDEVGASASEEQARRVSDTYRAEYQSSRCAVPGAAEMLRQLRGKVVVGIVSNNHQQEQLDKLRAIQLEDHVAFVVTSELAGSAKPDAAIFARALREAGCRAHEAQMVGDTWATDIVGAQRAGIHPVWFNRFSRIAPEPSAVVELRSFEPSLPAVRTLLLGGS